MTISNSKNEVMTAQINCILDYFLDNSEELGLGDNDEGAQDLLIDARCEDELNDKWGPLARLCWEYVIPAVSERVRARDDETDIDWRDGVKCIDIMSKGAARRNRLWAETLTKATALIKEDMLDLIMFAASSAITRHATMEEELENAITSAADYMEMSEQHGFNPALVERMEALHYEVFSIVSKYFIEEMKQLVELNSILRRAQKDAAAAMELNSFPITFHMGSRGIEREKLGVGGDEPDEDDED